MNYTTQTPPAPERAHVTVIKWTTHRQVVELASAELSAYIDQRISFGDELRDVSCVWNCWCDPMARYEDREPVIRP